MVTLRRSKTDQEGQGAEIAVPKGSKLKPVEALDAWLAARDALTEERDALMAELNRTNLERDALAAASARWFEAATAVTVDIRPAAVALAEG